MLGWVDAWVNFRGGLATVEAGAGGEELKQGPCACPLPAACTRVSPKAPAPPHQQLSRLGNDLSEGTALGDGGVGL